VSVGGFGVRVHASPSTLATLRHGQEATIATSLVVREDSLTLFGFADADERDIFETMQTVSGVGPRLALAITAVLSPDQLRRAVAEDDLVALQRVPGIGKKSAQRIVLEIGDRLGAPAGDEDEASGATAPTTGGPHPEVLAALVGLGWTEGQATAAIAQVSESGSAPADDDVPGLLRAALSRLGGGRRG
jgi:Holliday junction DNA helicase RuvA